MLVEFSGEDEAGARQAAEDAREALCGGGNGPTAHVITDPDEAELVWTIRESGLGATAFVPGMNSTWEGWEDAAVEPARLGEYLPEFRELLDRHGYEGALYGHFGDGCVRTRIDFDLMLSLDLSSHGGGDRPHGAGALRQLRGRAGLGRRPRGPLKRLAVRGARRRSGPRRAAAEDVRPRADRGLP